MPHCCCSFTILAPLFGRLGDRYSRTKLMAGAAVLWSIATGLTALADHSPILLPALSFHLPFSGCVYALSGVALALCFVRALVGVGQSSYSTITPTLIADYVPLKRRATALGVFQAAIPMGFALGLRARRFSRKVFRLARGVHGGGTSGADRRVCLSGNCRSRNAASRTATPPHRLIRTLLSPRRRPNSRGFALPGRFVARVIGFSQPQDTRPSLLFWERSRPGRALCRRR